MAPRQAHQKQPAAAPPRAAVIVRPDTFGDLVLFSPALRALRRAWPETRLAAVVRRPYLEIASLLVPGMEWIATGIDPFVQGPKEAGRELAALQRAVAAVAPELVVAACARRHWLDAAVAAAAPKALRVAFGSNQEDPFFGVQVRPWFGREAGPIFEEVARTAEAAQDWAANFGLVEHLLGRTVDREPPSLSAGADLESRADAILRKEGLEPRRFVVCAAAGYSNVRIKTWPAERYALVLAWLRKERGMPALLVGHAAEAGYLSALAAAAGPGAARIWTGGDGDLPVLAGLISRAALYFGNDTGAMHLAAALGLPVVAVFGGGTWPRFQPAAARSIALVNPLPCFGCGWDCPFGEAPCVQAVGVEEVKKALGDVVAGGTSPPVEVRSLEAIPRTVSEFMGRVAALARERTAAHLAREQKLEETAFLAGEKDGEIAALKAATDEKDAEIVSLKAATDEKDGEIAALKAATDEKDAEIEAKDAEIASLKAATDEKDGEIEAKHAEIAGLSKVCEERLNLIVRLDADLRQVVRETGWGAKK